MAIDVYDTSAPQPEGHGGNTWGRLHPRLVFPNISRWDQVFERWTTDKGQAPDPYIVQGVYGVGHWEYGRRDPQIGPYLTLDRSKIGGPNHQGLWARAHLEVCRALVTNGVWIRGDTMSFNVIAWSPEKALVVAQHSMILGNHWVAIIDPSTIPTLEEVAR